MLCVLAHSLFGYSGFFCAEMTCPKSSCICFNNPFSSRDGSNSTPLGSLRIALWRVCQRKGLDDALPWDIADIRIAPFFASRRISTIRFSGKGFSQAHSQLIHFPLSPGFTLVWLIPQSLAVCSWCALYGNGLEWVTA